MENQYADLENRFDCACKDAVKKLSDLYKADYKGAGHEKLTAFFDLIQQEFDAVETSFIKENKIGTDAGALHAVRAIAKMYAKRCAEDYGRIS